MTGSRGAGVTELGSGCDGAWGRGWDRGKRVGGTELAGTGGTEVSAGVAGAGAGLRAELGEIPAASAGMTNLARAGMTELASAGGTGSRGAGVTELGSGCDGACERGWDGI